MPFMEWSDSLSVNNGVIDSDHKRLIELINKLHSAMMERQGAKLLGGVLDELVDYTKTHFGHEEEIMTGKAYPHYLNHKAEHDRFVKQVSDFQEKFKAGTLGLSLQTMDFLRDWLFNHIMKVDQQLGKWIAGR